VATKRISCVVKSSWASKPARSACTAPAQALELGLVDALGDEDSARRLACELAGLDPDKTRPVEFGKPKKGLPGLLPGRSALAQLSEALHLELAWSGQPLWLHRP
jgi:protease-4